MSKKRIIMMAVAGLVSFAGTFSFVWFGQKTASQKTADSKQQAIESTKQLQEAGSVDYMPNAKEMTFVDAGDSKMKKTMTQKRLKSLVYDIREKMREYDNKLQELKSREKRLQIAADTIKKDIDELNNLRVELASIVAGLKSERDKLLKSRLKITKSEKVNLVSIAAAYDKMDAASAGKILTNMSQMKGDSGDSSFDDAVKILHYMTDRTKAKLLAELVNSDPKLAANFSQGLKQIIEKE